MRDKFVSSLTQIATNDPNTFLVTGDLGFGIFDNFREKCPQQFINAGVSEQNMTGVAVGLALSGKNVFTYSIGNFSTLRCLEQIRNDAAYHNANITVVSSGGGYSYGALGMSHHATEDIAVMRALPNVKCFVPSTDKEVEYLMQLTTNIKGTKYLRLEKLGCKLSKNIQDSENLKMGEPNVLKHGSDICLIGSGGILQEAIDASEILEERGLSIKLVSLHTIKPIDPEALNRVLSDVKVLLVIEEHNQHGGIYSALAELLLQSDLKIIIGNISIPDCYLSIVGDQNYLRSKIGLSSEYIVSMAQKLYSKTMS